MKLIYVQLDREAIISRLSQLEASRNVKGELQSDDLPLPSELPFTAEIPLPYVLRDKPLTEAIGELDWNGIVDGILYVALYQPKHEHCVYYKDFLLAMEPELPHVLQDRLREQYDQRLWQDARDTVRILLFLLPTVNWPLLELCYLYEQEAEEALIEQRFADCSNAWNLAALGYKQLLERDDLDAQCYFQLGYYYLQCWNYPAAYQAFVSSQQLALSPEHPLWAKCHSWLQKIYLFELMEPDGKASKALSLCWGRVLEDLQQALKAGEKDAELEKSLWLAPLTRLDDLLRQRLDCGFLWYLRGFCLLYGHDLATLRGLSEVGGASLAFAKAQELGWLGPLPWQLPYYLGLSHYLEGSYSQAERCLLEVLRHNTEHNATLYWLEKIYSDLEDPRSVQYQALLRALNPNFPDLIQSFV